MESMSQKTFVICYLVNLEKKTRQAIGVTPYKGSEDLADSFPKPFINQANTVLTYSAYSNKIELEKVVLVESYPEEIMLTGQAALISEGSIAAADSNRPKPDNPTIATICNYYQ